MEERPDRQEDDEQSQGSPIPPDAPVETPEADPRTEHAPDPDPRPADPASPASTEEQIQQAFE